MTAAPAVAKACGELWKAMPAEEKEAYEAQAAKDKQVGASGCAQGVGGGWRGLAPHLQCSHLCRSISKDEMSGTHQQGSGG